VLGGGSTGNYEAGITCGRQNQSAAHRLTDEELDGPFPLNLGHLQSLKLFEKKFGRPDDPRVFGHVYVTVQKLALLAAPVTH
jgi:hypothetical protein